MKLCVRLWLCEADNILFVCETVSGSVCETVVMCMDESLSVVVRLIVSQCDCV